MMGGITAAERRTVLRILRRSLARKEAERVRLEDELAATMEAFRRRQVMLEHRIRLERRRATKWGKA